MEYVNLRKSDLKVSRLGFGCCPMGGHGWGSVSEEEFKEAVRCALDNGVTLYDTADIYGFGRSETLLGKFLKDRRNEAIIATKFGVRRARNGAMFYDNSPKWIEKALNNSLRRLGVSCIDLYQIHYLDGRTPVPDVFSFLEKKRKEGKIRYYGVSNISVKDMEGFALPEHLLSFQAEYSLARRDKEHEINSVMLQNNLSLLTWGSLGQGMLTGKYDSNTIFDKNDRRSRPTYVNFHGKKLEKNICMVENVKEYFRDRKKSIPQIAIRWILDKFQDSVALVGAKRPSQLLDNVGAMGWSLESKDLDYLDSISM